MRPARAIGVFVLCAGIVAAGYAVSPKELPTLTLVVPTQAPASEGEATS